MAGKTGTAQVRRITMAERSAAAFGRTRASPGGCATTRCSSASRRSRTRAIAAAAIIEHGGFGAQVAAPLVRDTMIFLFDKQKAMAALAGL